LSVDDLADGPALATVAAADATLAFTRIIAHLWGYSGQRLLGVGHRSAEVAKPVWERRSSEVAQTAVVGLYPAWDINSDAVSAADTFLAEELPPALRRLVIEGKVGVERALRAREFDAGG
jgi:hypothetical protein